MIEYYSSGDCYERVNGHGGNGCNIPAGQFSHWLVGGYLDHMGVLRNIYDCRADQEKFAIKVHKRIRIVSNIKKR